MRNDYGPLVAMHSVLSREMIYSSRRLGIVARIHLRELAAASDAEEYAAKVLGPLSQLCAFLEHSLDRQEELYPKPRRVPEWPERPPAWARGVA